VSVGDYFAHLLRIQEKTYLRHQNNEGSDLDLEFKQEAVVSLEEGGGHNSEQQALGTYGSETSEDDGETARSN
jgi:hypothetical protein